MKTCFKCKINKPAAEFYKHPKMKDGRLNKCKDCTRKDVSENYAGKREQYAEYERERYQRPDRRENILEYQRKRRRLNPERYKAHYAVTNAIRDGRLIRQPCEVCKAVRVEAHHDNYDEPLNVRWLCRKHHLEHHGKVAY